MLAIKDDFQSTLIFILKTIIGWGFYDILNNQGRGKGYQLKPKTEAGNPYQTLIILDITKTIKNYLYIEWKKWKSCFCFFTDGKQHRVHELDMITHDLECPWHDNCIICSYDITGADFENSVYAFGQSEKS